MYPAIFTLHESNPLPSVLGEDNRSLLSKDKATFKDWFNVALPALEYYWCDYIKTACNHQEWYLGLGHRDVPRVRTADGNAQGKEPVRSVPTVFNHSYDLVEQRVNRLARFKPTFEILPAHMEPQDEQNARIQKIILKQVTRRNKFEQQLHRGDRINAIMGSIYYVTEYDQEFGPYIDRKDKSKGREGDVRIKLQDPRNVFPWPTPSFDDAPLLIEIYEILHKRDAAAKYKVACEVKHGRGMYKITELEMCRFLLQDHVIIYRVLVRPSKTVPDGAYILCYQDGTILEQKKKYPYSHDGFPHERLTDIDLPDTPYPFATFANIIQPQKHHDKTLGLIQRNYYLLGHPKILAPAGSCKIESWANTPLFVSYSSGVEPRVVTFGTSHPEARQMLDWYQMNMEKLYGQQGASRGNPPPGTRSGVQLLFFEEQEQQRASIDIIKRNELIRRVLYKAATEVQDWYPTSSPERLIHEVGKNNETVLRAIATANLSADLEVEIQNSTAFSESKAVRNQEVLDFLEKAPGFLTNEQLADILEIGHSEKAWDIKTAALRKAEWENQEVRYGRKLPEPGRHEDILVHLQQHYIEVQSIAFSRLPKKSQQIMFDHIEITEGLAEELMDDGNELFISELKTLRQFPMFYRPSPSPEQAAAAVKAEDPMAGEVPEGMDMSAVPSEYATPGAESQPANFPAPPIE